ncbi:MAG: HD domain-containing protein [Lachnospiraceae bacterium]|nr:HD domain-containing protein [Lachnospiraceae bacterium]
MERANQVMNHKTFREHLRAIATYEEDREFCGHDMVHFMDVARIAMIYNLTEREKPYRMDVIYAAALLHDIGRDIQYEDGSDHAIASSYIAQEILQDCGYRRGEIGMITEAIFHHRDKKVKDEENLNGILYRADKASRACYSCPVEGRCDWKKKKKNLEIKA